MVLYLGVQLHVRAWIHEISVQNRLLVQHLAEFAVELVSDFGVEEVAEPCSVLDVDETVLEHSEVLVVPKTVQLLRRLQMKTKPPLKHLLFTNLALFHS